MRGHPAAAFLEYVHRVHEYDVYAAELCACLEHQADEQSLERAAFLVVGQRRLGQLVTVSHQRVHFVTHFLVVVLAPEPHERLSRFVYPLLLDEEYWGLGHVHPHYHEQQADGKTGQVQVGVVDHHAENVHVQHADVVHEYEQRAQTGLHGLIAHFAHVHRAVDGRPAGSQAAQEPGHHQRRLRLDHQQDDPADQVR